MFQLKNGNFGSPEKPTYGPAKVVTPNLVICKLPSRFSTYVISVTYDRKTFSKEILLLVYNTLCYDCDNIGNKCKVKVRNLCDI